MGQLTVQDLCDYLEKNFKSSDRLCFWREGGAYVDCEYAYDIDLGASIMHTVADDKKRRLNDSEDTESISREGEYEGVRDDGVIVY